jgi:hypothetical protein
VEDTLMLSRFKAKHPASKVAVQTQKVTSKVDKANRKRRIDMGKMTREQRLAELNREVESIQEEFSDVGLEENTTSVQLTDDEVRLSRARSLNERTEEYMAAHGTDYTTALREVSRLSEGGASEPSVAEVEHYMKQHDISDFGQAVRAISTDSIHHEQAFGSVRPSSVNVVQENRELEQAIKARGYNLDD